MTNTINSPEIDLISNEVELLMRERSYLLRVAGAAAGLIAELKTSDLPIGTIEAADLLATQVNTLSEETLQDALTSVHAEIID